MWSLSTKHVVRIASRLEMYNLGYAAFFGRYEKGAIRLIFLQTDN